MPPEPSRASRSLLPEPPGGPRVHVLVGGSLVVGLLAGLSSAGFLTALDWVTERQRAANWLLYLLPLAGLGIGLVNQRVAGRAVRGNRLVMEEIESPGDGVPARMAPMVLVGTLATHLFGGSAGREGTALQMSASLTDTLGRRLRLRSLERRSLLVVALSAGFGAVFGVPWAGAVFGLEVGPLRGRARFELLPVGAVASLTGDLVVRGLGVSHLAFPDVRVGDWRQVVAVAAIAPAFGLAAWAFLRCTSSVAAGWRRAVRWAPLHPALGGAVVVLVTLVLGTRSYNGLSIPLVEQSFGLVEVGLGVWAAKLLLTAITVGSGFAGGEVTPLFVIGATLGAAVGHATGGPVVLFAAVGMVATFGAAANAPLACIVMGMEVFGSGATVPLVVGCLVARVCSSRHSIYDHAPKTSQEHTFDVSGDG